MPTGLSRKLVAEGLGTALLVATVVGSGIMAAKLSGGNEAVALLCNTIPTGAMLVVLILMFGELSGAHFNPAVSLAFWRNGELPSLDFGAYVLAQLTGGIIGTLLAHGMFDVPLMQISTHMRTGPSQWLSEFVATFGLLLIIFGARRYRTVTVSFAVGLYITSAYWFTASTSFANPAVTIARSLTDSFSGINPASVPAFILAQCVAAVAAGSAARWIFQGPNPR